MKKMIIICITLVIILGLIILSPWGTQVAHAETINYEVEGGQLKFNTSTGMVSGFADNPTDVIIPTYINGIEVKGIDSLAFADCKSLNSISIPTSIKYICEGAFTGCCNLKAINIEEGNTVFVSRDGVVFNKNITELLICPGGKSGFYAIPDGIKNINSYAFDLCRNLIIIRIPHSVTSIGEGAFFGCYRLYFIGIPDNVTTIGDSAFEGCESLYTVKIPANVTNIGECAFFGCNNLSAITVEEGNTVFTSKNGVLFDKSMTDLIICPCNKGKTYTIPDGVTSIHDWAFSFCDFTSISIPSSVTSIGVGAFDGCGYLTNIDLPNSITSLSDCVFYQCYSLTTFRIPDGVISIGGSAFNNCYNLSSINIPDGVRSIGDFTFANCDNLSSINIPDGVRSIGDCTFANCDDLSSINIPAKVISIGWNAFSGCSNLTSIIIPDSVNTIDSEAFSDCSKLSAAYFFGDAPDNMGNDIFAETNSNFTIYHLAGKLGFSNQWNVYPTALFDGTIVNGSIEVWTDITSNKQKSKDESWTITFNKAVDSSDININNIFVAADKMGNHKYRGISVTQAADNNRQVKVTPPAYGWLPGGTCYLFIGQNIKSAIEGQALRTGIRMKFSVKM